MHQGCIIIANYYLQHNDVSMASGYLVKLLKNWKHRPWMIIQALDEIFHYATQTEHSDKVLSKEVGLALMRKVEEEMQSHSYFCISRKVLDFVFARLFSEMCWPELEKFEEEYKLKNYTLDIQNQLSKVKFLYATEKCEEADEAGTKLSFSNEDTIMLIREFRRYYTENKK